MVRIAVVEKEKCNPIGCGDYLCMRMCPVNRTGKECITKGEDKKIVIDENLCTGCGICVRRCPYGAIHIINLPEALTQNPVHQYGMNGFRLYNMPIPKFGKVVGIIGRNGIGKSTAIKILAGVLEPNLGDIRREKAEWDELIDFYKGTEAQKFFERVKEGKIKISYKPQQVELIPRSMKGKVRDLLKKVDEKGEFEKIVKMLDLKNVLDNDIRKISGGELQKVAIAATVLKKANLYVFDEPTSYLDIKQRIRVSKFIRELADEETAVLVVEHDLIILDYMTDLVHLMYGEEAAYGIVSLPKTTRTGINIYLSGYMKEENIRFRDKEIRFEEKEKHRGRKETEEIVSWKGIKKKLGKFNLTAEEGNVCKHDVIGVLGANGIGKTSFVKILAGVIKQDKGKIKSSIKVSYKPQYIESSDEVVANVLKDTITKFDVLLMRPMKIKQLLTKKVSELSGGELQRLAIVKCLSQEADLYLLDEPSAYLDVEQRLKVSKVINDFIEHKGKSTLVVDHDLLFIDYMSQGLMVFDGEPAVKGMVKGPFTMEEGMNHFLEDLKISFRRDPDSRRPRANKLGSVKDREQKEKKKLYYA